ncbi:uncharacterized protein K02A2.6-like [Macrobrachium nipponense]|uniref:uncharacterized protein K02A2.6-like n=1 Tax=Macrobrachium nipponense TaxID=159736 RepID=UPI0030C86DBD
MLRKRIKEMLHEGHKGIVAMKAEARSFVYWPNMDQDLEQITSNCALCITNRKHKAISPLSWPSVDRPRSRLHVDYCGPIDNMQYLIIIDYFSKFIDVYACKNITSEGTIQCLRSCFANYGIPDTIVSDNATSFMSRETQNFFQKNGVRHCSGAPYNPSTNGLAERAVRIFKTNFKKFDCNLPAKTRMAKFLYTYRRTVQSSTGCSPAELLFGRKFKGPLDVIMPKQRDEFYVHESKFRVGDAVYAKNFGKGPEWVEAKIIKALGERNYLVSVDVNGILTWKRHLSQLFERKMYNTRVTDEPSLLDDTMIPYVPVVSSPRNVQGLEETNNPIQNSGMICNPNVEVVGSENSNCDTGAIVRKSTRVSKKPRRLIEQI